MVLLGVQNGANAACMQMVNIEWRPFRKPSRIIFRILIYIRGEVLDGKNRSVCVLFKRVREYDGLFRGCNLRRMFL